MLLIFILLDWFNYKEREGKKRVWVGDYLVILKGCLFNVVFCFLSYRDIICLYWFYCFMIGFCYKRMFLEIIIVFILFNVVCNVR